MGPQLGEEAVSKAVKCAKNMVQYWLSQWKESKDLSDMKHSGRVRATIEKREPTNLKASRQPPYCCNRRWTKCFEAAKQQETIRQGLKEAGAKLGLPTSKPLLTGNHRYDSLKLHMIQTRIK